MDSHRNRSFFRFLDKRAVLGAVIVIGVLVLNLALGLFTIRRLNQNASAVSHTRDLIANTSSVLAATIDAETGQRGYLITGRDEYLEPYNDALGRIDSLLTLLRTSSSADAELGDRIERLDRAIDTRLGSLAHGIELRRESPEKASEFFLTGVGRRQTDDVRAQVNEIAAIENALLDERQQQRTAAYRLALTSVAAAGLFAILAVIGFFYYLRTTFKTRSMAAAMAFEEAERYKITQEASVTLLSRPTQAARSRTSMRLPSRSPAGETNRSVCRSRRCSRSSTKTLGKL